jgi:hypothetical protein
MTAEKKLGQLIADGHLFIFHGEKSIEIWANANDTFAWGTADAEPLKWTDEETEPEIDSLFEAVYAKERWSYVKWLCRHRNQPPMPEIRRDMRKTGDWPFSPFNEAGEVSP